MLHSLSRLAAAAALAMTLAACAPVAPGPPVVVYGPAPGFFGLDQCAGPPYCHGHWRRHHHHHHWVGYPSPGAGRGAGFRGTK